MKKTRLQMIAATIVTIPAVFLAACEKESAPTPMPAPANSGAAAPHDDDDHGHAAGHGGPVIDLGVATIGGFTAKATRDDGEIVAGKDAPIDVTVTAAAGSTAKAVAVRFWIGTEDAKGSVKAKAEIEDADEPDRWHVHAEIPDPIPAGSKLWVEIEDDKGAKTVGSFDLKQ